MLSKNPNSKEYKAFLALEYYKEAGSAAEKNLCRLSLKINSAKTSSYCEEALKIMEELFNVDLQINDILIKEYFNYARYNKLALEDSKVNNFFLNTLGLGYFFIDYQEYDEFFYLKKSSEQLVLKSPLYTHHLASLTKDKAQKEKYLKMHENYLPSIYELGLYKKHIREYTDAIKYFEHGSKKGDSLSSYSLSLLSTDFQPVELESLKSCGNDQSCIYVYLFQLLNHKNYNKEIFKQNLAELNESGDLISTSKLKSFKSLIPIMQKYITQGVVLEEKDYKGLDGHAVAILGYLAFKGEFIDIASYDIIKSKREDVSSLLGTIDKKTSEGSAELALAVQEKKRIFTDLYSSFTIKLLIAASKKGYDPASLFLGKFYYQKADYQEAEKYLLDSYNHGNFGSFYPLAKLSIQNNKYSEAFTYLSECSDINPLAKYSLCMFYVKGYHVEQDTEKAQKCLSSMLNTNSNEAKGLANYTLAVLNIDDKYGNEFNLQKANKYLEDAQKYGEFNTDYLEIIINMKSNNCKDVKETLLQKKEHDMYFKYLMAVDYIQGSCLTKDDNKAQILAREIIANANFNDENIINCAIEIIERNKVESSCAYPDTFFHDLSLFDSGYMQPSLSDLYQEESFLFLPNFGLPDQTIMSFVDTLLQEDL